MKQKVSSDCDQPEIVDQRKCIEKGNAAWERSDFQEALRLYRKADRIYSDSHSKSKIIERFLFFISKLKSSRSFVNFENFSWYYKKSKIFQSNPNFQKKFKTFQNFQKNRHNFKKNCSVEAFIKEQDEIKGWRSRGVWEKAKVWSLSRRKRARKFLLFLYFQKFRRFW